ncbi:sensor histidine kinase [Streptomyces alkaliterrae]|uniref:histidine kinase n=1 Tax=Streptomyces alkaliterrae TaxID=2213162 RepID=A0A5P0YTB6_9ACTN|nr:sensor histidine kinase [Streptomyces alkaliterrae]MBB1257978.1 sensor histidine kinase [Streptomyces alkaliterrae]MQS03160.1 sensor histidine kinase [Streptomyces alkaliterrae]
MNRLYEFLRRHPTWVDGSWAAVLVLLSMPYLLAGPAHYVGDTEWQDVVGLLVVVCLALVVTLRRRFPEQMLILATVAGLAQVASGVFVMPMNVAMLVIVFTVAARTVVWASRYALVAVLVAPALAVASWGEAEDTATLVAQFLFYLLSLGFAWVLGDSLRTRRAYYAELEERAARLEREREAQSQATVAAERTRIARELHDVVAHNVSVMVVQADGAAYVMDTAPDQARQALETISSTGRQALTEMRRLLGVLRSGEGGGGEYVPQPGVEQLNDLVEQVRGTGLPVDFRIEGAPRPLPSGVELTAYRIVQEALTNTRKHGGPHVGATVRLTYGDDALTLLAEDDGRGAPDEVHSRGGADGLGHGLIGMRERIGMVGGSLEAGPRTGGGFRVRAELPFKGAG